MSLQNGLTATADLVDLHGADALVCELDFRQFGGSRSFAGGIRTIRCYEDNALVRECVSTQGSGQVLVVDGGGSPRAALVGEQVATLALENGWEGLVINGCVRDAAALAQVSIGIKALRTQPRRSRRIGEGELDIPVRFGGITFLPGAHLHSDDDGIVVLAQGLRAG